MDNQESATRIVEAIIANAHVTLSNSPVSNAEAMLKSMGKNIGGLYQEVYSAVVAANDAAAAR